MRHIPWLVLVAVAAQGCRSCRQEPVPLPEPPPRTANHTDEPDAVAADPYAGLEALDPGSIGLESPDPDHGEVDATVMISVKAHIIKGDMESAKEKLGEILEQTPGNLEALYTKAELLLRERSMEETIPILERLLAARFPEYAGRTFEMPSVKRLEEESPRDWTRLVHARESARRAWADAMSGPGAFLLVAPPYPEGNLGDAEADRLHRGWVVFLDTETGRFLPLTSRSSVAGFLLDRAERRLHTLSWRSHDREQRDDEGEIIRPALLQGVSVTTVDLTTFETSRSVGLGADLVEARLSARSGHLLATVVRLGFEDSEGKETSYEIDTAGFSAEPASKAPPGPMDLIVAYGLIEPPALPSGGGFADDADTLPGGWTCATPGPGLRLCAVPTRKKSVIHDLILERTDEAGSKPVTLAKRVGILQIDIL